MNKEAATTPQKFFLLQKKIESGKINFGVWFAHFSNLPVDKIPTCKDCAAFNVCIFSHDKEPIDCFSSPGRHLNRKPQ